MRPRIVRHLAVALPLSLSLLAACAERAEAPTQPVVPVVPVDSATASAVDVAFCAGAEPQWLAFQDGRGAWTRVRPVLAGGHAVFHHDFTDSIAGVAVARTFASGLTSLSVNFGAPAELALVGDTLSAHCAGAATRVLFGSVVGLDSAELATVGTNAAARDVVFPGAGNETFTLTEVPAGPVDILAMRSRRVRGGDITGLILRRSPERPDGDTLPVFDFASAEAFHPAVRSLTIAGLDGIGAISFSTLRTAHGDNSLSFTTETPLAMTRPYWAIPESRLEPGDLQSLSVSSAPVGNVVRSATAWFHAPVDRVIAVGDAPSAPVLDAAATTPSLRPRARFAPQPDYDRQTTIGWQQGQNTVVTVTMTPAYAVRSGAGFALEVPELGAVEGFDARWALHAGTQLIWTSTRIGGTLPVSLGAVPRDGDTRRIGTDAGFVTF